MKQYSSWSASDVHIYFLYIWSEIEIQLVSHRDKENSPNIVSGVISKEIGH